MSGGPHEDRLAEISRLTTRGDGEWPGTFYTTGYDDVRWLVSEVERLRAASPPEIHSERIRRQWANSTAREITLSMAECLTEGRPVEAAIARAEEWLRRAALRDAPPQDKYTSTTIELTPEADAALRALRGRAPEGDAAP
jgi:hypothetical protein